MNSLAMLATLILGQCASGACARPAPPTRLAFVRPPSHVVVVAPVAPQSRVVFRPVFKRRARLCR
jgi:hypothetical protein